LNSFLPRSGFHLIALLYLSSSLILAPTASHALIGPSFQMQLGNPTGATSNPNNTNHYLILRSIEAIDYNATLNQPNWASWDLTASDVGSVPRSPDFFTDTNLPPGFYRVTTTDYNGVGAINFNRGHMCPSEDRTDTTNDNQMTFFMSNIIPQAADNNQIPWANFEGYCRALAAAGNELLIICGPSGFGTNVIPSGKVPIPDYTWKIAVAVPIGSGTALERITISNRVIALRIPNTNGVNNSWQSYITTAKQIEADTGFTFFTAIPPTIASAFRYKVDGLTNPPPNIVSFSPLSGNSGANVIITGTNFGSTLSVNFNGANAVFSVDSATQITAVVPTNATSGTVTVTTPNGAITSASSFTVNPSAAPDLIVALNHSGSFAQGDTNESYTITVSNIGALPSAGSITVTDTLPAGLTASAMSGDGWTANLATLTCTRTDSLAAGTSFPPITLTVAVATNAIANITNFATVSGGGDNSPANNTASDATIVNSLVNTNAYIGLLVGWDVSGQSNFGVSPLASTTNASNVLTTGLTRGSGVVTSGASAARAWGGVAFTNTTAAAAIASNQIVTFSVSAATGYAVSFSSVGKFDYRRSSTGPPNGVLQYQIASGAFADITNLSYSSSSSTGGSLGPFDLSGIAALQNIGAGTNITFRIVNYGGGPSGTWYIYDVANNNAADYALQGSVAPVNSLTPIQSWRQQWFGTTSNSGNAADAYVATTDGMPNLLKYALGLNPLVATNSSVVGDISTGFLRISAPRNPNATDVSFSAEVSSDLSSWTTEGVIIETNTATLFQAYDPLPVASGTHRFIRLRVTRP
jgi:DNA/RNA endonuclease G (NUC1)